MKVDYDLKNFLSELDKDLTVGNNHLLDDMPSIFKISDILYFFSLRDKFWPDQSNEIKLTNSIALTEFYLSILLHIHSSDYQFNEEVHYLESTILYGDLLTGAYATHLLNAEEKDLLLDWANLQRDIHQQLLHASLDKTDIETKKTILVKQTLNYMLSSNNDNLKNVSLDILLNKTSLNNSEYFPAELLVKFSNSIDSSEVIKTLIGD